MNIDHWLIIAVIISTLIAPIIGVYAAFRINQPKPSPEANQPKNRSQRIGGWLDRLFQSPWILPPSIALLDIYLLLVEFIKASPVTRRDVFLILFYVISLSLDAIYFFMAVFFRALDAHKKPN